jgi:hypothetical protein
LERRGGRREKFCCREEKGSNSLRKGMGKREKFWCREEKGFIFIEKREG